MAEIWHNNWEYFPQNNLSGLLTLVVNLHIWGAGRGGAGRGHTKNKCSIDLTICWQWMYRVIYTHSIQVTGPILYGTFSNLFTSISTIVLGLKVTSVTWLAHVFGAVLSICKINNITICFRSKRNQCSDGLFLGGLIIFYANQWNTWYMYTQLLEPDQLSRRQSMVAKRGRTNRANVHTTYNKD